MPVINFKLKDPVEIIPWGIEPNTRMHWFGLTDGDYWLHLGDKTIYEHTNEIAVAWDISGTPYTDYYIVRFLEDFTEMFAAIGEPIPEELYQMTRSHFSLFDFYERATTWLEKLGDNETADINLYFDKYHKIIEWIYSRTLTAGHLKYGPKISFFRCNDKISIIWRCDHKDENDIPVWTAGNGEVEMLFDDFVREVKNWGELFFAAMEIQVGKAVEREWGNIEIDKARIKEEQNERNQDFIDKVNILTQTQHKSTDWSLVSSLIKEMSDDPSLKVSYRS
jgi:hypothetical protein